MVLTSHDALGSSGGSTGFWLEELVVPRRVFTGAGFEIDMASPRGGRPPVDPASAGFDTSAEPELDAVLDATMPLDAVRPEDYQAVFLVGGHGTMWDFPEDGRLAGIVTAVHRAGRPVAAVCHGVAGLLGATDGDGRPLVSGRTVTGFSDAEEAVVGADSVVPFSLQQRLVELGAVVEVGEPFGAHVRRDGGLITGQNPASSEAVASATVSALAQAIR